MCWCDFYVHNVVDMSIFCAAVKDVIAARCCMGFPYNYPLGLPKGTVRATIALVLSLTLFVLVLREDDMASSLGTTVALILAFYFGG